MKGKIGTGSENQNQEAKKAKEAKPASDLDGSTPSNQPPLVNISLLNQDIPSIPGILGFSSQISLPQFYFVE